MHDHDNFLTSPPRVTRKGFPLVNQTGYTLGEAKRFTCPGAPDGTPFHIIELAEGQVLAQGAIKDQRGDFTNFNPSAPEAVYVIEAPCFGRSYPFRVADSLFQRTSTRLAYQHFIDVRGITDPRADPSEITGGGPSRDGGGQTVEALWECLLYASNPALFERWFDDLPRRDVPDLIELILWHGEFAFDKLRYNGSAGMYERHIRRFGYAGEEPRNYDYPNMLDQLAAVCAAYAAPGFLREYLPFLTYLRYRQACLELWEKYDRHKEVRYWVDSQKWIDEGRREFSEQGNAFGQGLWRNLMMYLSEKEFSYDAYLKEFMPESRGRQLERFAQYTRDCAEDIIANWDFHNPWHMWRLRNAEHITPQALAFLLIAAPELAPMGTREKLASWRDYMMLRTENLWHYPTHSDTEWAHPRSKEVGTIAGLGGSMFAVAHVLGDEELRARAWSQVDFVFGRNPMGAHLSNKSILRVQNGGYWEGVTVGWPDANRWGTGLLGSPRGTLDGSPLDSAFPYNPDAHCDPTVEEWYATEGWSITNRGWISTVAFSVLGANRLRFLDPVTGRKITSARVGDPVTLELRAPLNFDPEKAEWGRVELISWRGQGTEFHPHRLQVPVSETAPNSGLFTAQAAVPASATGRVELSYGHWNFTANAILSVESASRRANPAAAEVEEPLPLGR